MGITDTTPSEPDRSNREQRTRQPLNLPPRWKEDPPCCQSPQSCHPASCRTHGSPPRPVPWPSCPQRICRNFEKRETKLAPSPRAALRHPVPNPPSQTPNPNASLITRTPPHLSTCHKCLTPHHQKTHANISPHKLLCGPDTRLPSLLLHRHPITPTAKKKNNRLLLFIYARPPPPPRHAPHAPCRLITQSHIPPAPKKRRPCLLEIMVPSSLVTLGPSLLRGA